VSTFSLPKKYFTEREEEAFVYLIDPQTGTKAREEILQQVLYQPLFHLTETVALRYCPCIGILGEDELVAQAYENVNKNLHKFRPGKLDKAGKKPLRAYSYLSAVVKNFSLGYGKDAAKYDKRYPSFDATTQDYLEQAETTELELHGEQHREVARDQRMQRVLLAIKRELAEGRNLRTNEAAVGRALLVVLEVSVHQQEGWDDDERITRHYLRKILIAGIAKQTGLNNKEINAGFRRFMPLYLEVCAREETADGEEANEDAWSPF
jgi:hypothetical protein